LLLTLLLKLRHFEFSWHCAETETAFVSAAGNLAIQIGLRHGKSAFEKSVAAAPARSATWAEHHGIDCHNNRGCGHQQGGNLGTERPARMAEFAET